MLFVAMVCGGCTPWAHRYQVASSGTVGCAPGQIQISDHARGAGVESWRATCGGEVYACSAASQRGAALCTAVASRPSSAASVAEARRPQLDVTRQGDRVQRVTAVFRTYEGTVTLTFSPEVSAELVVLTFTPRTTSRARACDNFSMESSVGSALRVALVEGAASVPLRELLAAGQGHVRARICDRSWAFTADEVDALRRLGEHAEEALRAHAGEGHAEGPPTLPADPTGVLRARVRERAAVIRACADTRGLLTVEIGWNAEGVVSLHLRGVEDAAITDCASDALGIATVQTSQAGRLIQVIEAH